MFPIGTLPLCNVRMHSRVTIKISIIMKIQIIILIIFIILRSFIAWLRSKKNKIILVRFESIIMIWYLNMVRIEIEIKIYIKIKL